MKITRKQMDRTRKRLKQARDPMLAEGTTTDCAVCGNATMVTTNRIVQRAATPMGLVIIPRLPGAQCTTCGAVELDAAALAIIQENLPNEIKADYVTTVSKSGKVPAILVKEDLRRVLNLTGSERMSWKVIDSDHAYVEVLRS
jgi:YgiT-type zinc finger domain-containing protein